MLCITFSVAKRHPPQAFLADFSRCGPYLPLVMFTVFQSNFSQLLEVCIDATLNIWAEVLHGNDDK
jgi:hypothetical protein